MSKRAAAEHTTGDARSPAGQVGLRFVGSPAARRDRRHASDRTEHAPADARGTAHATRYASDARASALRHESERRREAGRQPSHQPGALSTHLGEKTAEKGRSRTIQDPHPGKEAVYKKAESPDEGPPR